MITLPMSSSMYQSMVGHINGDGTICIAPMQVDKLAHHSSINQITNSNNSITNQMNGNNSVAQCNNSVSSSFSSVSSQSSRNSIVNCQQNNGANQMYGSATNIPPLIPCDNQINQNGHNNLLELCHVLGQNAQNNHIETLVSASTSNSTMSYNNAQHGQTYSTQINDRKATRMRKLGRNQQSIGEFNGVASYANDASQLISRNVAGHMIAKSNDTSDGNNNVNNDANSITIESDLKHIQMPALHLTGDTTRLCKSNDQLNTIEFDEHKLRTIKMERDIGIV